MPATRSSTASRAVRNSTQIRGCPARSRRSTSSPSKSGSITSSTTASGRNSRAARTALVPSPAVRTSQPSYRSTFDSNSARLGSSSTTSTRTGRLAPGLASTVLNSAGLVTVMVARFCSQAYRSLCPAPGGAFLRVSSQLALSRSEGGTCSGGVRPARDGVHPAVQGDEPGGQAQRRQPVLGVPASDHRRGAGRAGRHAAGGGDRDGPPERRGGQAVTRVVNVVQGGRVPPPAPGGPAGRGQAAVVQGHHGVRATGQAAGWAGLVLDADSPAARGWPAGHRDV